MKGTAPQKAARLLINLAFHPRYASRYVSNNLLQPRSPLDLELPWFSYAAIDFLDEHLKPTMAVFEYGSGGSTLFFARRAASVVSVEDNPEWFHRVKDRLAEKRVINVSLKLCPFNFKDPAGFENSDYLRALSTERPDVIVVDGSEEWTQVRPICFQLAEKVIRPGGIIIVDDSWRYPSLRENNQANRVERFQSAGPGRPGVTSTDVFFY
jgi:predicted O-methyltransferase YrrM